MSERNTVIKDDETLKAFQQRLNPSASLVNVQRIRLPEDEVDQGELKDLLSKLVKPPPRGLHPIIERVLFEEVRITNTDMMGFLKIYLEAGAKRSQVVKEGDSQRSQVQDEIEMTASTEPAKDIIEEAGDSSDVKSDSTEEPKDAKDEDASGK